MDVNLGNIKLNTLADAWNRDEMKIIRDRKYSGKCGDECQNFKDYKCNSCLGRRTIDLTNESLLSDGCVKTFGCWNYKCK